MNGLLDTAKILAAALKLAESHTKKEIQKLREDLDLHSDELRENLIQQLRDELEIQSAELRQKYNSLHLIEGDIGPIGPRGDRGFMGATGDRGSQGLAGEQGIQGIRGESGGAQGIQGVQGIQGEQGVRGAQGEQGEQGIQGDRGEQGEQGIQGDRGEQGEQGIQGDRGEQGIQGDRGEQGEKGNRGIQGDQGFQGVDGPQGEKGIKGDLGKSGKDGKDGKNGKDGVNGEKGDPGSDANIAPLEKKFEQLTNTVETKISRIAYGAATGRSPGSGEVNLKYLDDIDLNSVNSATNGQVLVYNSTLKKWQANTSSSGNSTANAFIQTITTRNIIPEANNVYSLGSYGRRFKDLWLSGNGNFGNVTVSNNLTVSGNTSLSRLILSNVLSTAYGGTGLSSVTTNGILFGANSSILGYLTGSGGEILQIGNGGVPKFDKLDGGSF